MNALTVQAIVGIGLAALACATLLLLCGFGHFTRRYERSNRAKIASDVLTRQSNGNTCAFVERSLDEMRSMHRDVLEIHKHRSA